MGWIIQQLAFSTAVEHLDPQRKASAALLELDGVGSWLAASLAAVFRAERDPDYGRPLDPYPSRLVSILKVHLARTLQHMHCHVHLRKVGAYCTNDYVLDIGLRAFVKHRALTPFEQVAEIYRGASFLRFQEHGVDLSIAKRFHDLRNPFRKDLQGLIVHVMKRKHSSVVQGPALVTETEEIGVVYMTTNLRPTLMPESALVGEMFMKMSNDPLWHSNDVLWVEIANVLFNKIPVQVQRRPWLAEVGSEFRNRFGRCSERGVCQGIHQPSVRFWKFHLVCSADDTALKKTCDGFFFWFRSSIFFIEIRLLSVEGVAHSGSSTSGLRGSLGILGLSNLGARSYACVARRNRIIAL